LDEALFSQRCVASSLHPGTAKRAREFTSALGRSTTGWRAREWRTIAAFAEVHRTIKKLTAKTERIASAPIAQPLALI